jgi:parallel beta-helix repeat protein
MLSGVGSFLGDFRRRVGASVVLVWVTAAVGLWVGAGPADAQVACGQVITEDTRLDADLDCGEPGTLLTIGASGITLDLGGHTIRGGTVFAGILNEGHDHVTIENGTISVIGAALLFRDASHNVVRHVGADGEQIASDLLGDSDHNTIRDGRLGSAIYIDREADHNRIARNLMSGRDVLAVLGSRNRIVGNEVHVVGQGVVLGGNRDVVSGNTFRQNIGAGIQVEGDRNVVRRNRSIENFGDGIAVLASARGTRLSRNRANRNRDDGIDIANPHTRLVSNSANHNGDLGIEAVPGVFARGNSASGNGNPLQCLNVFCR